MDGALARLRWRRRGAWLWPAFAAATGADAVIGHALPPAGDSQTLFGAALLGGALNLLAVLLCSRPLGALIRKRRRDLPAFVAKDYGGTLAIVFVAAVIVAAGLAHRATISSNARAMQDAIVRAQAWIGDHAPDQFRRDIAVVSTYTIEPGSAYRMCVLGHDDPRRTYCVVVRPRLPFARSVSFGGYEPNSVFAQGAW
jgi:hypothetical protein